MTDGVDPQLITMEEAAVTLGKSTRTVARLVQLGTLKVRKVMGRNLVLRADVERLKAGIEGGT